MAPRKTPARKSPMRRSPRERTAPKKIWKDVDAYLGGLLAGDEALESALEANRKAGLPAIDVSRLQGKFLTVLAGLVKARRILEIGTLGGYSTICFARALPRGDRIVTLEIDPHHAETARGNLRRAGVLDRVEIRVGRAADSLAKLAAEGAKPFDLIFIDADKPSNPEYFKWALKLARPGTAIVVDNVVRDGKVADAGSRDADVLGTRRMFEQMAAEPRVSASVLQTVGAKGYDGLALAVVLW